MITHNIQFQDKISKFPEIFVFWSFLKNFVHVRIKKRVRISHGKRVIRFRAIEIRLYFCRIMNRVTAFPTRLHVHRRRLRIAQSAQRLHKMLYVPLIQRDFRQTAKILISQGKFAS